MLGISEKLIFSNLRNALRPRKTSKYILTNLNTILRPTFSNFSNFGSLRGGMTNNENEREFNSALFDTYVGFQYGV